MPKSAEKLTDLLRILYLNNSAFFTSLGIDLDER